MIVERDALAQQGVCGFKGGAGCEWAAEVDALRRGEQLNREHAARVLRHRSEPAGRKGRHADVIFLVRRGRQAVDRGRVRERLVLGGERSRGDLRDHEPGIESALAHQERGQLAQAVIDQHRDATLGERADLGDGERQVVGGKGHGLRMEVAAGEHVAFLAKDERVVGDAVGLEQERACDVLDLLQAGARNLGLAAQRIRVLHAVAVLVRAADVALAEHVAERRGNGNLRRLAAGVVDARIERHAAAERCVHRHRAGEDRACEQVFRREQGLERERGRDLGAVQQREPFLRPELERLDTCGLERRDAILFLALHTYPALADQRERQVRERREVTGGANRALRRHDGMDACVREREKPLNHDRAHAREAAREACRLQHQDHPHRRVRERRADAGRVRAHEVELQRREFVVGDPCLCELAEAGVDAVERLAGREPRAHRRERRLDGAPPALGEGKRIRAARNAAQVRERDRTGFQCERRHQRTDGRSRPCSCAQAIARS